ncbi:hypothetical protein GEV33_008508 [Tenebrio molitor]|uniref:Uncharacterized protein n=1 Tax=Tenebrio molitor TaxID=7067 RepID=A0A8J6LA14_TENMO|nr:hypothetical protein GEV33_008508 [Tenebrio molitor]
MHVRMQGNMQYVFHDVCHIQIITYFYGWCTVLETLGPWCLPDKKFVVRREKLERQRLKMLFFSTLMTTSSPKLDTSKPITFFNNPLKWQWSAEYDRFFAYTKIFPLWDQRKPKDNCQYLPDIRENIYEQEKDKPVPVLTSYNYGLPCRRLLDQPETGYRRIQATGDFKRRRGVMKVIEKKPQ